MIPKSSVYVMVVMGESSLLKTACEQGDASMGPTATLEMVQRKQNTKYYSILCTI